MKIKMYSSISLDVCHIVEYLNLIRFFSHFGYMATQLIRRTMSTDSNEKGNLMSILLVVICLPE